MILNKFKGSEEAILAVAKDLIDKAKSAIELKNQFNLVLTGGNTPKALHKILVEDYKDAIDWSKVYFFIGDERYVPSNDSQYNGLMAMQTLLIPLNILPNQVFLVNTNLSPEVAAIDYFDKIKTHFDLKSIEFDYILLGMGEDAHTASLFPETTILNSVVARVEAVYVNKLNTWRISFTAKLINQSKNISVMAFGKAKAEALLQVQKEGNDYHLYPAKLIRQNANWYVDEATIL